MYIGLYPPASTDMRLIRTHVALTRDRCADPLCWHCVFGRYLECRVVYFVSLVFNHYRGATEKRSFLNFDIKASNSYFIRVLLRVSISRNWSR